MSATAMTEASSNGQIGHPAAWMIANNLLPRAFPRPLLRCLAGVLVLVRRL
jgi:hypothetical protein